MLFYASRGAIRADAEKKRRRESLTAKELGKNKVFESLNPLLFVLF